ncbi:rod-binding protein [Tropicimonas sp. IMCC6043]|uniref:rod-binding protein n=1 Tax=Tropicimonas sp. IMCC6043 TaxID=2510645 RepID=UPI00101D12C4|nr:rod-binding protein [Tropicimonas sp. IMCC6043]RYH09240.1 flagellar biosynthesis protein FlgJ [Tropicimonas sp. IMCC6043]
MPPHGPRNTEAGLRKVAQQLEAAFLSEMLKHAGLGDTPEAFGGGAGEDQFSSLLRNIQADRIASRGGIGLAESIFNSLRERTHD